MFHRKYVDMFYPTYILKVYIQKIQGVCVWNSKIKVLKLIEIEHFPSWTPYLFNLDIILAIAYLCLCVNYISKDEKREFAFRLSFYIIMTMTSVHLSICEKWDLEWYGTNNKSS